MPDYDVDVEFDGSIVLIQPLSEAAIDWMGAHVEHPPCMFGRAYPVEPRYAMPIIEAMIQEGFRVDA